MNVIQKGPVSYSSMAKSSSNKPPISSSAPPTAPWHKSPAVASHQQSGPSLSSSTLLNSSTTYPASGTPGHHPPAYTPVKSSKWDTSQPGALRQPPPPPPPSASPIKQWPESLKVYVQRCFDSCGDNMALKTQMENTLKDLILASISQNRLELEHWDRMSVPNIMPQTVTMRATPSTPAAPSLPVHPATAKMNKKKGKFKGKTMEPGGALSIATTEEIKRREERSRRFQPLSGNDACYRASTSDLASIPNTEVVIGTCTALEKNYYRLTSAPDPSTIRPLHVLKQTLVFLQSPAVLEQRDYVYLNDQYKSLRQDLTVQRIRNAFTVHVYESHGRLALGKGDLGEFNQCQSQLASLYCKVICDSNERNALSSLTRAEYTMDGYAMHPLEFIAYKILYFIHTANTTETNRLIGRLSQAQKENTHVRHALNVKTAVIDGDYLRLFAKLYPMVALNANEMHPTFGMSGALMSAFMPRERLKALKVICSAYRPSIPLLFIMRTLCLSTLQETYEWLVNECECSVHEWLSDDANTHMHDSLTLSILRTKKSKHPTTALLLHLENFHLDTKASLSSIREKVNQSTAKIDIKGQI